MITVRETKRMSLSDLNVHTSSQETLIFVASQVGMKPFLAQITFVWRRTTFPVAEPGWLVIARSGNN